METTLGLLDVPAGLTWSSPALWLSTWFGTGLVHPLQAGMAVATVVPIALLLRRRDYATLALAIVAIAGAISITMWEYATGTGDDRRIVIDEVAGFLLILVILGAAHWKRLLLAAPLYLAIDRWKPWPLEWIEARAGVVGIIGDDLAAGVLTILLFLAAERLLPSMASDRSARS